MLKKLIALSLMASFLVLPGQVSAAPRVTSNTVNRVSSENIQPRYNVFSSIYPNLYLSNGEASCQLYMTCSEKSASITAKVTLYKISSSGAKERLRYWPSITSKNGVVNWVSPSVSITSGDYLMVVSATATGPSGSDSYYDEIEASY